MIWQDIVFTIGSVIFIVSLFPSILDKHNKPARITSIFTSVVLFIFAFTQITLNLFISSILTFVMAVLWLVLYFQVKKLQKI